MTTTAQGTGERWLVAARLSKMSKRDRERGDVLITGIQTQDQRSAEWALSEGKTIVHVTRDRNVSGAISPWQRPELGPWLTDPDLMSRYDGIVGYEASRLSRDYLDLPMMRRWAEEHGKKLHVIKERLDWPGQDGERWGMAAERSYGERQECIERTVREKDALILAGKYAGGTPPFGYVSSGPKYDHYLTPTDAGRQRIPEIFRRVIAGESLNTIARWLDSEGVTQASGGKWWARSIGQMVRNQTYIGRCAQATSEDVTVIHRCDALIDSSTFRRAGEALDSRPKRGPSVAENRAMLAGSITCPRCPGSPMYRITPPGREPVYRCSGRGSQRKGCGNLVSLAAADAIVSRFMGELDDQIMVKETIPGHDHQVEIDDVTVDLRNLNPAADDFMAQAGTLHARLLRLKGEPSVPARDVWRGTGETYSQHWASLGTSQRRVWIAEKGIRVYAARTSTGTCESEFTEIALGALGAARLMDGQGVSVIVAWVGSGIE